MTSTRPDGVTTHPCPECGHVHTPPPTVDWTGYPLASLPWAVPIGSAAHLAGDLVTKQGVPLLWPIRHQFKLGHVTTGGDIDTILGWLLTFAYAVLVSYALYVIFLPPLHFAWSGH